MPRIPSPQQAVVIDFMANGTGSANVIAVAGAGKTTTLVDGVAVMKGTTAICAFNKKIADEFSGRLSGKVDPSKVRAGTFHSFGFSAWKNVCGKQIPKVDGNKLSMLLATQEFEDVPASFTGFVSKLTSLAKQRALGCEGISSTLADWRDIVDHFDLADSLTGKDEYLSEADLEERIAQGIQFARRLLRANILAARQIIDFDDMIYMPLIMKAKVWQYDNVLIDEAQDTNPARRLLARRMLKAGGRLVAVGDPRQAIYGFTGADADAMDLIAAEFGCVTLPLTVTFRCPKAVVQVAQQWVSHIEAAPTAPEGVYRNITVEDFENLTVADLTAADAVLCRNTAPLVSLAFTLIRKRIPCHVEGRDIGKGLIELAQRWKSARTVAQLGDKLTDYVERETAKLMAKKQEMKAEQLQDKVDTLRVIMSTLVPSAQVAEVVNAIYSLFGDTPEGEKSANLTLSTIHKSKGREWQRVYWFGRAKWQPSKYARQDWQLAQEDNLCYVAATRSMGELIEVAVP